MRTPMRRIRSGCCARARGTQPYTAPPSPIMKSRRRRGTCLISSLLYDKIGGGDHCGDRRVCQTEADVCGSLEIDDRLEVGIYDRCNTTGQRAILDTLNPAPRLA